jgi:hypothetical protein
MMMMPFICSSFRRSVCAVCRCCDRSNVLEICGGRFPSQSAITSKKHLSSSLGFKSDFRIFRGGSKWSFSKRCCNSKACLWSHLSSSPIPEAGSGRSKLSPPCFFCNSKTCLWTHPSLSPIPESGRPQYSCGESGRNSKDCLWAPYLSRMHFGGK